MFNLEEKKVLLNCGIDMPLSGLGIYALHGQSCIDSVKAHLKYGGRLLDTAHMYGNEETVGEAVRQAMEEYGIAREEIFVITKLYPNQYSNPKKAIELALERMNVGYLDMLMLHHPGRNDVNVYREMEKYMEKGLIRSLGLSNWYMEELPEFLNQVNIKPSLVQNEIHPYYQERKVVPFIQDKGIAVQSWYPLGGRGYMKKFLSDPVLTEIAQAHGRSVPQVILRWHLQREVIPIPGSSSPAHIKENLEIFDFELSDEEMASIRTLDRNEKHDWY
jgi:diketogulonate reductase-like aldo/keto reductase